MLLASVAGAEVLSGRVAEVTSGDTLLLDTGDGRIEVRLSDIAAPQGSAYFAPAARELLLNLTASATVQVDMTGRAGPERVFGQVRIGALDVNRELVRRGAAWVCLEYAASTDLLPFERAAQRARRGLWGNTWQIDTRVACRVRPPAEGPATAR